MTVSTSSNQVNPESQRECLKTVVSQVALLKENDSSKLKKASKENEQTGRTSKKQKLSSVRNDIESSKKHSVGSRKSTSNEGESHGGGLFGGDYKHWQPDPLCLFMFDNAALLIELCQESQEALTKAQMTQTQEQIKESEFSAAATVEKGVEQADQQEKQAQMEFAQAGVAGLQTTLQCKDLYAGDDTYSKDLDRHDDMIKQLNSPAEATSGATSNFDQLSQEDKALIKDQAAKFKLVHQAHYETELGAHLEDSFRTKLKRSPLGLNRSTEYVQSENEVLANRAASKKTYNQILGNGSTNEEGLSLSEEDLQARKQLHSLLNKGQSSTSEESEASTVRAQHAQEFFAKELFGEGEGGTRLDAKQRMDLIADWNPGYFEESGNPLRDKILKSYAGTEEGRSMKADLEVQRDLTARKMERETNLNRKAYDTRQMLCQNLSSNVLNGVFDTLKKKYITEASNEEATASLDASIAQMYGTAINTENSFIANSIKDMTGIFEWFQSMHGQLLSAQAAAAGV